MTRVLIADDEPLARQRIVRLLATETDFQVIAECADGLQTAAAIAQCQPEVLFLDVEMPDLDGLSVLREIEPERMPVTVFTTAYDRYAIQAFEANAIDYLLKPYDDVRFRRALLRVRTQLQNNENARLAARLMAVLDNVGAQNEPAARLVIKSGGRVVFLGLDEIDWVEAAANYVRIHAGNDNYLMRQTITAFQQQLPPAQFMRIHRSIIVNVGKIKQLEPCNNGEYIVILRNGKELSLSRSFRDQIHALLDGAGSLHERRCA